MAIALTTTLPPSFFVFFLSLHLLISNGRGGRLACSNGAIDLLWMIFSVPSSVDSCLLCLGYLASSLLVQIPTKCRIVCQQLISRKAKLSCLPKIEDPDAGARWSNKKKRDGPAKPARRFFMYLLSQILSTQKEMEGGGGLRKGNLVY